MHKDLASGQGFDGKLMSESCIVFHTPKNNEHFVESDLSIFNSVHIILRFIPKNVGWAPKDTF